MPLDEEGAKWSCEPCIRGHRSSKCQHFDRLMMKVPKAGRPLAKCPHPKGSCSCERVYAFMVRIPKGSTCLCRPLYQVPTNSTETPSSETPSFSSSSATSIATNTPGTSRVQKHTRKLSNFQHPSNNVTKALDSELIQSDLNNDIRITTQPAGLDRSTNYTPASGSTMKQEPTSTMSQKQMQGLETKSFTESKAGGCCSWKTEPVTPVPQQRSCCGGVLTSNDEATANHDISQPSSNPAWMGSYDHLESHSWSIHLPNNNFASQNSAPCTFSNQISYGNQSQSNQPLIPQTLQDLDPGFQNNVAAQSMDQLFLDSSICPHNISLPFTNESSYDCSCGDGCQCLGCVSHPFNETTRQHVQEMGYMMTVKKNDENTSALSPFSGLKSPPILSREVQSNHIDSAPSNTGPSFTDDNALPSNFNNTISSPTFPTDQFMQPSEYYTLEYPVGLTLCSDTTGTCQCGNDCNCVGCLTHNGHDGVILESLPTESQQKLNETVSQQFRGYFRQGTDIPSPIDQYSASALSPPVVEALFE